MWHRVADKYVTTISMENIVCFFRVDESLLQRDANRYLKYTVLYNRKATDIFVNTNKTQEEICVFFLFKILCSLP